MILAWASSVKGFEADFQWWISVVQLTRRSEEEEEKPKARVRLFLSERGAVGAILPRFRNDIRCCAGVKAFGLLR